MGQRRTKSAKSKHSKSIHPTRSRESRIRRGSDRANLGLTVSPAANRTIKQLRREIIGDSLDLGRELHSSHVHFVADVLRKAEEKRGGSEKSVGPLALLDVLRAYDAMLK